MPEKEQKPKKGLHRRKRTGVERIAAGKAGAMSEDVLQARARGQARVLEATAASLRVEAERLERQARRLRKIADTPDDKESSHG